MVSLLNLRVDRAASLYLVNPILRHKRLDDQRLAIPMYHSVSETNEEGVHPYYRTAVSPKVFATQMRALHRGGYSVLSFNDLIRSMDNHEALPAKPIVLTFDDGLRDFWLNAFPVLQECGFTATVFLPTDYISDVPRVFQGKECLTWSDVRELAEHGVSFGSHTASHCQLRALTRKQLEAELDSSKRTMEDKMGREVSVFSCPFAFPEHDRSFVKLLQQLLQELGYRRAVSTAIGTVDVHRGEYFLKRLPMNSVDDPPFFEAKLNGAYDWIHSVQYAVKVTKEKLFSWSTPDNM